MAMLLGKVVNPLVGLAAEAYSHNKNKKAQNQQQQSPGTAVNHSARPQAQAGPANDLPPTYGDTVAHRGDYNSPHYSRSADASDDDPSDEGDLTDHDEDDWARDGTQQELARSQSSAEAITDLPKYLREFFTRHPDHLRGAPYPPLPCPVIIPQRRPNARSRGFVRAYAPVLHDSGVDKSMFLEFVNGFERAIKGEGAFTAFNIAVALSSIASSVATSSPEPFSKLVALAVHLSVEAGRRTYESVKTNGYLDEMNKHLFKPHGLYAMIMTYKPGSSQISQVADMNKNTISAVAAHEGGRSKVRTASGKAMEDQIPECAPLVYPELDKAGDEEKANAFKRSMAFISDYQDKRARANWAQENPNSRLNVSGVGPSFSSSLGDPSHSAYQGGIINLLTGGRVGGRTQDGRADWNERRNGRGQLGAARRGVGHQSQRRDIRAQMGASPYDNRAMRHTRREYGQERRDQGLSPISFVKRTLGENIIYLMIVNMPTEAEMAEARARTERNRLFG